jgi:hypothetical protein
VPPAKQTCVSSCVHGWTRLHPRRSALRPSGAIVGGSARSTSG